MNALLTPIKKRYHAGRRTLANGWLNGIHSRTTQIAITGSYGKTSTTHGIYHALARHAPTVTTDLNLDTIYNVPITALQLRGEKYIVFELGIDRPHEMAFHLDIVRPDIAVMTGITPVHSDDKHLGSLDAIIREKRRLIEALSPDGLAVLHREDAHVREMAGHTRASVVWYGTSPECDYRAENIQLTTTGSAFRAVTPAQTFDVETAVLGAHNCVNLLAAVAVAERVGIPAATVQAAFAALQPLGGRLSVALGPLGLTLIDDALRANPASTRAGLIFLGSLTSKGQKIAVLGEMGELGDSAVEQHAAVGRDAAGAGISRLICVGDLTRHTAEAAVAGGMPADRVLLAPRVHDAAKILQQFSQPGDMLYLKGSLMRHMERIPLLLEGRRVGCEVISCPFYCQCTECEYLEKGYGA